jgi:hypothetical protein
MKLQHLFLSLEPPSGLRQPEKRSCVLLWSSLLTLHGHDLPLPVSGARAIPTPRTIRAVNRGRHDTFPTVLSGCTNFKPSHMIGVG